ncbi:hypothetical protein Ancab_025853 [Ancistrocladus abbreviatus]
MSNPRTSKSAGVRDEMHMSSLGKISEGALIEDMKVLAERIEKGKDPGSTAVLQSHAKLQKGGGYKTLEEDSGPNPKRAVVDSDRRDLVLIDEKTGKPIKVRGTVTKNARGSVEEQLRKSVAILSEISPSASM